MPEGKGQSVAAGGAARAGGTGRGGSYRSVLSTGSPFLICKVLTALKSARSDLVNYTTDRSDLLK